MNYLKLFLIFSSTLIIKINGEVLAEEHSVQTCFRSNRPAVCIAKSLCKNIDHSWEALTSNCTDSTLVCCPIGNEVDSRDAFIVPRWEWSDWIINWTASKPTSPPNLPTYYPPLPQPSPVQSNITITVGQPPAPGALPPIAQPVPLPAQNESSEQPAPIPGSATSNISPPSVQGCGSRNIAKEEGDLGFIVGGSVASPHSWPWVTAVYSNGRFICGAAIIDRQFILCAAHCVSHGGRISRAEQMQIMIGAHDRRSSGKLYNVEKIIVHSGYNERIMQNDISMFKLATPIVFGKTQSPICLPPNGNSCVDYNKITAYLAGWGTTAAGGMTSNELREVAVPTIPLRDCQRAYDSSMVTSKQICAGYLGVGGKDSCQGDSGGPMVIRPDAKVNNYIQCGIVSWGRGCAESRYPGVYTKVSEYLDWIKANKI